MSHSSVLSQLRQEKVDEDVRVIDKSEYRDFIVLDVLTHIGGLDYNDRGALLLSAIYCFDKIGKRTGRLPDGIRPSHFISLAHNLRERLQMVHESGLITLDEKGIAERVLSRKVEWALGG